MYAIRSYYDLSRRLQERRVYPAIDIERSSTRREELLLGPDITPRVWLMRRMYDQMIAAPPYGAGMDPSTATEAILQRLSRTTGNQEFLETLHEANARITSYNVCYTKLLRMPAACPTHVQAALEHPGGLFRWQVPA